MNHKRSRRYRSPSPDETQLSLATTVFWLMCVMSAFVAETVVVVTWLLLRFRDSRPLEMVHGLSIFLAVVTGGLAMVALAIVWRVRDAPPPRSVVTMSLLATFLAIALAVMMAS